MKLLLHKTVSHARPVEGYGVPGIWTAPVRITLRSPYSKKYLFDGFALTWWMDGQPSWENRKLPVSQYLDDLEWIPTGRKIPVRSWADVRFWSRMARYEAEQVKCDG